MVQDRHGTGQTWTRRDGTGSHGAGQDRGQAWDGLQGPRGAEIWVPQGSLPEGGPGARAPASCPLSLLCNYRLTRATVEARAPTVHGGDSRESRALATLGRPTPITVLLPHFLSQRSWRPVPTAAGGDEGVKPEKRQMYCLQICMKVRI